MAYTYDQVKEMVNQKTDGKVKLLFYGGMGRKSAFECAVCGHRWYAQTASVVHLGSGCPECAAKNSRLTQEEFEKRLGAYTVDVLGEYKGYRTPVLVRCKICNREYEAWPNNLVKLEFGCNECDRLYRYYKRTAVNFVPTPEDMKGAATLAMERDVIGALIRKDFVFVADEDGNNFKLRYRWEIDNL